jgi:hypothetical protein
LFVKCRLRRAACVKQLGRGHAQFVHLTQN